METLGCFDERPSMPAALSAAGAPAPAVDRSLAPAGAPVVRPDRAAMRHGGVAVIGVAQAKSGVSSLLTKLRKDTSSGAPALISTCVSSSVQRIESKQYGVVTAHRLNGVGGVPPRGRPD